MSTCARKNKRNTNIRTPTLVNIMVSPCDGIDIRFHFPITSHPTTLSYITLCYITPPGTPVPSWLCRSIQSMPVFYEKMKIGARCADRAGQGKAKSQGEIDS